MGKVMEAPNTKTIPMGHDIHVGGWEKQTICLQGHPSHVRKGGSGKGIISPQSQIMRPIRVRYSCLGVGGGRYTAEYENTPIWVCCHIWQCIWAVVVDVGQGGVGGDMET